MTLDHQTQCNPNTEFACQNGQCVPKYYHCNYTKWDTKGGCADESHLRNCGK